jgi:hypothetical protein
MHPSYRDRARSQGSVRSTSVFLMLSDVSVLPCVSTTSHAESSRPRHSPRRRIFIQDHGEALRCRRTSHRGLWWRHPDWPDLTHLVQVTLIRPASPNRDPPIEAALRSSPKDVYFAARAAITPRLGMGPVSGDRAPRAVSATPEPA